MLTPSEKDTLYKFIASVIDEDVSIKTRRSRFNEETIAVVEEMVAANRKCNDNMKTLITNLIGGSAALSKGWLKRLLKTSKTKLRQADLDGYGCMVSVKSRWKTAIIRSTY